MKNLILTLIITLPLTLWGQGWERYYVNGNDSMIVGSIQSISAVQQTSDGGFITCGSVISQNWTNHDIVLIKTDINGDTLWQKRFNNYLDSHEIGNDVKQTSDGGYIICGSTRVDTNNFPRNDIFIIKTNSNGDQLWTRIIGDTLNSDEIGYSIEQTYDGGYIIGASISPSHLNFTNTYIVKTNNLGMVQWSQTYSECYAWRPAVSVTQTNDGGYILGTQHHDTLSNYNSNIIRTDSLGIQLWNVTGPSLPYNNHTVCAEQTSDGGYILSATIVDSLSINNNTNIHIIKYDSLEINNGI